MTSQDRVIPIRSQEQEEIERLRAELEALRKAALTVSVAAADVIAERARQVAFPGYAHEHDDVHVNGEIARVAADYAMPGQYPVGGVGWVFNKSNLPRRLQLLKAGAMILAEIERLDRADTKSEKP